ncbi:MAG: GNAT family N-acetyltransferase, partial [Candidatus Amulumruptor sp.]|nr:GNAT family N-acetyltransferase [Candidatus Amulumruptor sp.]
LLIDAFTEDERRELDAQRQNIDILPNMHCCVAVDESENPIGFITYWELGNFCYIEHFAIAPLQRDCGYGAHFIYSLLNSLASPVVLEVELPDNSIAQRRINFYKRIGFVPWAEYNYIQPPYRSGGNSIPMMLMAYGPLSADIDADNISTAIHNNVYGTDGSRCIK